jgi:hypothetical protein
MVFSSIVASLLGGSKPVRAQAIAGSVSSYAPRVAEDRTIADR